MFDDTNNPVETIHRVLKLDIKKGVSMFECLKGLWRYLNAVKSNTLYKNARDEMTVTIVATMAPSVDSVIVNEFYSIASEYAANLMVEQYVLSMNTPYTTKVNENKVTVNTIATPWSIIVNALAISSQHDQIYRVDTSSIYAIEVSSICCRSIHSLLIVGVEVVIKRPSSTRPKAAKSRYNSQRLCQKRIALT